jgi:hypothetical protein
MYFKQVHMSLQEAIAFEVKKGFETRDEFREVMMEIADEYNVTVDLVYDLYYNQDIECEV